MEQSTHRRRATLHTFPADTSHDRCTSQKSRRRIAQRFLPISSTLCETSVSSVYFWKCHGAVWCPLSVVPSPPSTSQSVSFLPLSSSIDTTRLQDALLVHHARALCYRRLSGRSLPGTLQPRRRRCREPPQDLAPHLHPQVRLLLPSTGS